MEIGNVVRSLKGKDAGKVYVVYSIIDKDFVSLVNGDTRKIDNPKRKRIKHIEVVDNALIINKQNLLDADIKKVCKSYLKIGGSNA